MLQPTGRLSSLSCSLAIGHLDPRLILGGGFAAWRVLAGRPEVPVEIENLMAPEYATLLAATSVVLPPGGPVGSG
ncbi:MAG: hypothetical protein ACO4CG_05105, partial [Prochlorothrix sp.]